MPDRARTVVIGAGPGGATAAMYLARFNQDVLLLDAGAEIRGRTSWAYELENVLGFSGSIPGPQFLQRIEAQLGRFGVARIQERVNDVRLLRDGRFSVAGESGERYHGDYLVVAVGVHDIMPDVPDVDEYFGHSIFPCPACNWYQTKDRRTGIVANSDRGLVTARAFNAMQPGSALCVFPDRPDDSFSPELRDRAEREGIKVYDSQLVCLNGSRGKLQSVVLSDGTELDLEILYTRLGVKRHDLFLNNDSLRLRRDADGYIEVDYRIFESSVPNVFAVGPCNTGQDQVMVAAGQGAIAAMEIHDRILTELGI